MFQDTVSSITDAVYQDELISEDSSTVKLYGRDHELDYLTNMYNLVKNQNSYRKVVISGQSGSGKTFLVSAFQELVLKTNGFFCSGKHFQNSHLGQDVYPALISAFSDLCDIVLQSESFDKKHLSGIKHALGKDGYLLAKAGANVAPFLDESSPCFSSSFTKSEPSLDKFKTVCKSFLRAMSASEHPVVLFLDDMQWADTGTIRLLDAILKDTEIRNFMLILAYRDDDGEALSAINGHLENITDCHLLKLDDLDSCAVKEMVLEELSGSTLKDCDELCALISRKTQGHPFHVKHFIYSIKKNGLLSLVDGKWVCDIELVRAEMMISDSLANLLSSEVQRLDNDLQDILRIASLLGYHFVTKTLQAIANEYFKSRKSDNISDVSGLSLTQLLESAVEEGFLEKIGDGYQFSHDKLQSLFQESMTTDYREKLHAMIGRQLLLHRSSDYSIYQAAVHLNIASKNHFNTEEERVELARTNLEASKFCEFRSAYLQSVYFLQKGLDLLDNQNKWSDNFDLSFALTKSLAKMQFFVGNLEGCKTANIEVAFRAKSFESTIQCFLLNVDVHIADDDLAGLVSAGRKEINKLGLVRMPRNGMVDDFNFLIKLIKVRRQVDKKTDEELLTLPYFEDSKLSTTVFILERLCLLCILKQHYPYGCFCALLAMELTMKIGLSSHAANVFYVYGAVEVASSFGEGNSGRRWLRMTELTFKFLRKFSFKDSECHIIPGLAMNVLYRKRDIREILDVYPEALKDGYEKGDIVSFAVCAAYICNLRFWMSDNLKYLEKQFSTTYKQISDLGQYMLLMPLQPILQLVLNMRNSTDSREELVILNGKIMDEKSYMSKCANKNESFQRILFLFCKMYLAYTFGFYEKAEKISKTVRSMSNFILEQSFLCLPFQFYAAMTSYERHRSTGRRKYLRAARKTLKVFAKKPLMGSPNAFPFLKLLELEDLSVTHPKDVIKLKKACQSSIDAQIAAGFTHLEALTNERASCILSGLDNDNAKQYHNRAMHVYKVKWGATAKYNLMLENAESAELENFPPDFEIRFSHENGNSSSTVLDNSGTAEVS